MVLEIPAKHSLFKNTLSYLPPSEDKGRLLADTWQSELLKIVGALAKGEHAIQQHVSQTARNSIDEWKHHQDHGSQHSYFVYEGIVHIAKKEGIWKPEQDNIYQAYAVLHDLAQTFPLQHPATGEPLPGDVRKLHPDTMARMILLFGIKLGLSVSGARRMAMDIRHHDDTYSTGQTYSRMSPIGNLLADSDKLFGAGLSHNPNDLAHDALERNKKGGIGPAGWYLIRDDITPEERRDWQYGDRWLGDRLSAVLKEMNSTAFYTETGKAVAEAKRGAFVEQARQFYLDEYHQNRRMISLWEEAVTNARLMSVVLVGKNPDGKLPLEKPAEDLSDISGIVEEAYNRPIQVNTRPGHETPRGWKIQVTIDNQNPLLIDPSIARYETEERFMHAINAVITIGGLL